MQSIDAGLILETVTHYVTSETLENDCMRLLNLIAILK